MTTNFIFDPEQSEKSIQLGQKLQLPVSTVLSDDVEQWLEWINNKKTETIRLALCNKQTGPVSIDFLSGKKAHRRQFGGGKGQPLVRAMGTTENGLPKILDATAGMGGDSFVLASLGFEVKMVERSHQ